LLLQSPRPVQDRPVRAFVFTPKEKRVLIFIVAAFVLGAGTKHYRDTHPPVPAPEKTAFKSRSHRSAPSALPIPGEASGKQKSTDFGSN
jgi:hypothetical protein